MMNRQTTIYKSTVLGIEGHRKIYFIFAVSKFLKAKDEKQMISHKITLNERI